MRRQGILGAVAIAVALTIVVAARFRSGEPPSPGGLAGDSADGAGPAAAPDLAAAPRAVDRGHAGRGASIEGTVRRGGRPAAARVEAYRRGDFAFLRPTVSAAEALLASDPARAPRPDAVGTASDDGRYGLGGLADGAYDVVAVAPDGARGRARADVDAAVATRVDLDLADAGGPLRGVARYASGAPFLGRVDLRPVSYDRVAGIDASTTTDGEGRFAVEGLSAGTHETAFVAPGPVVWIVTGPRLPRAGPWEVVVDLGTTAFEGRVVDADSGTPVAEARVALWTREAGRSLVTVATSSADGAFRLAAIERAMFSGTVVADGYAPLAFDRPPPGGLLRIVRAGTVEGVVRRAPEGTPVAGAAVRVLAIDRPGAAARLLGETTTRADGAYEVRGLPPGEAFVFADAPGLVFPAAPDPARTAFVETAVVVVPGRRVRVDVRLLAGVAIEGRVVDAAGAPVADASVAIETVEGRAFFETMPAFPPPAWATATDGTFRATGLREGFAYVLRAARATAPFVRGRASALAPGQVEIALPDADALASLDVSVVAAADGAAVAGALVEVATSSRSARAGADGRARIVGMGSGAIVVRARGFASVAVPVPEGTRELTVRLAPARRLEGRVEGPGATPVGGAAVLLGDPRPLVGHAAVTADDGSFVFDDVEDVEHELRAHAWLAEGRMHAATARARPGTSVVLRLAEWYPGATPAARREVRIRVEGPSGVAVARAEGRLVSSREVRGFRVFDGAASLDPVSAPGAQAEVWGATDAFGRPLGAAPARVAVPAGASEVVVRLEPGVRIDGRVVGPDGAPVAGVQVLAVRLRDAARGYTDPRLGVTDALASTRSAADGAFALDGVGDGEELRLVARAPAGFVAASPLPVRGGARGVELRLAAGVAPRVVVLAPTGEPLEGAEVRVVLARSGGAPWIAVGRRTDRDGAVRLPPLDASRPHRLEVTPNRADVAPWANEAWVPRDTTVALERVAACAGVVVDEQGAPIPGAGVTVVPRVRVLVVGQAEVTTDEAGAFRADAFAPGAVDVRVLVAGRPPVEQEVVLPAPSLRLVVGAGRAQRIVVDGWPGEAAHLSVLDAVSERPLGLVRVGAEGVGEARVDASRAFTLWGSLLGTDLYVLAEGARWREGDLRVAARRGASLRGVVVLPPEAWGASLVASRGAMRVSGTVAADGAFEVRGLPPGRWKVEASASSPEGSWRAEAHAEAGDAVRLVLEGVDGG